MTDQEFRTVLWRAFIMLLKAYGKRYGFCQDIEIVK